MASTVDEINVPARSGRSDNLPRGRGRRQEPEMIDRPTVIGLAATVALLTWVMLAGAGYAVGVFWRFPSLALVVGGAILVTLPALPARRLGSIWALLRKALRARPEPLESSIVTLVALAEIARRKGLLALERPVSRLTDEFLKRAMRMAIDGHDPAMIESVVRTELEGIDLRHTMGKGLLESMGRSAPVFGMIGTLIGLVAMLGQMDNPARIGPGMAVALLTTLYGLIVANVFCLPLARKLAHRSSEELLHKTIVLRGVLAIQAGDHPRIVAHKLRAYLPADGSEYPVPRPLSQEAASSVRKQAEASAVKPSETAAETRRDLVDAA